MVKRRVPVPRYKSHKAKSKEKLILSLFLVFSVLAIIVLFGGQPALNQQVTGAVSLDSKLNKMTFNPNEKISGNVKLGLESDDLLPPATNIILLITTNATKCPKYVCPDNKVVDWYKFNKTTQECVLNDADPEGTCCRQAGSACSQIVVNRGFESFASNLPASWSPKQSGMILIDAAGYETDVMTNESSEEISTVAFTDSSAMTPSATNGYIALTQSFGQRATPISQLGFETLKNPTVNAIGPITSFKALSYKLSYDNLGSSFGCAFEVIIKSTQGRNLHYYYKVDNQCLMPTSTTTERYIARIPPSMDIFINENLDLYSNWKDGGGLWKETDTVSEIWLVSHGKKDSQENLYSQRVRWDDVKITKMGASASTNCTSRSTTPYPKKCCDDGAGIGSYYGDQLTCPEGQECWSSCTIAGGSIKMSLVQFISKSTTKTKSNRQSGMYKESGIGTLYDYGEGNTAGYTACEDTGNTTSTPINCRGWNNIYELNLNRTDIALKTPTMNGSYELTVRLTYTPEGNCGYDPEEEKDIETCLLKEMSVPFYVGGAPTPSNCSDADYGGNSTPIGEWSNWTECLASSQTRTRQVLLTYHGTEYGCNNTRISTETGQQACTEARTCDETDYDCTEWMPLQCPSSAMQSRTCTKKTYSTCKDTGYRPEESQSCTYIPPTEEKPYMQWIIWAVVFIVVAVAIIIVVWKVIIPSTKGKGKAETEVYPELTSYIHDAQATGASRQDITAKLQEAGWPKDQIDDAFKQIK